MGKKPSNVSVLEVMEAIQGPVAVNRCALGTKSCPNHAKCKVKPVFSALQDNLLETLRKLYLSDLVEEVENAGKKS